LPSVDPDTAASVIGDGLELLSGVGGSAAAAGAGLAGLSNPTLLVLGSVAAPIANAKLVELSEKADLRLQQYVEETDGDEEAYLRTLASSVSHLQPDGDELADAAVAAGRDGPEHLRELLQRYADEDRAELESAVDRILRGVFDDLEDELCDAFGTGNVDEARALLLDFRDVVEARRPYETFGRYIGDVARAGAAPSAPGGAGDEHRSAGGARSAVGRGGRGLTALETVRSPRSDPGSVGSPRPGSSCGFFGPDPVLPSVPSRRPTISPTARSPFSRLTRKSRRDDADVRSDSRFDPKTVTTRPRETPCHGYPPFSLTVTYPLAR
jgi:hypothetical protein